MRIAAGYVARGQGAGPLVLTRRAGYFDDEGLDVELNLINGSRKQAEELMAGNLLFGNAAVAGILPSIVDGSDLVFITGGINQQFLVARPGISTMQQLAGGSIAVNRPGELPDLLARIIDERMRLRGQQGLVQVTGIESSDCERLVIEGKIDSVVVSPPSAVEMRRCGCTFVFDFSEIGLNYNLAGLITRKRTIRARPDVVRRFVRAYVTGLHRYKTDRELAITVQQEYSRIEHRSIAAETYDITEPGMPYAPHPTTEGLQTLLEIFRQHEPRANRIGATDLIDGTFVRELEDEGFIAGLNR